MAAAAGAGAKNICCVGDDDQIDLFVARRGGGKYFALREGFSGRDDRAAGARITVSTAPILAAASGLIAHNEGRLGKTLRPGGNDAAGEPVEVVSLWDSDEEARMVGERIEKLRRDGHALAEMAVLVRAGYQTRPFEERLITLGVPYRVIGGLRFYERAEIRDAIAYARVLRSRRTIWRSSASSTCRGVGVGEVAMRAMHERRARRAFR